MRLRARHGRACCRHATLPLVALGVHTALSFSADSQGEPKLPQHGAERVLERRRGVAARAVAARPRMARAAARLP